MRVSGSGRNPASISRTGLKGTSMSNSPMNILLVEDQKYDFEMARRVLQQHYADVVIHWAARGEDAFTILKEKQVDVIVLDYELPGWSGLETLQQMQVSLVEIPTIFVTGNGDEETAVRALKLGARDYLVKDSFGHYLERLPFVVRRVFDQCRSEQLQEHISKELQRRNDRLRATIASMDDLVFVIGKNNEFVSYYQPPGKHSLSATPEFFLGQSYFDVLPDHVSRLIEDAIAEARNTEEPQHFEYPLRSMTNTYWFEAKLTIRYNRQGKFDGVTIVVRDITARKQAETVLRRYNLELEQRVTARTLELTEANERLKGLDRLRAKLIDDMAHELRTPITNLKLYLELLHQNRHQEKAAHYFEVLHQQVDRLEVLIGNIVTFSEVQAQEMDFEMHNVVALMQRIIEVERTILVDRGLALEFEPEEKTYSLWGNEEQLKTILRIPFQNAIKYSQTGTIRVRMRQEEDALQISIEDEGIGIPDVDQAHIFERFYRGSNVSQLTIPGSGMGLATLQELLTLYRGHVSVESEENSGAKFVLTIPVTAARP
jgi:PAS domain S-box-containing protein